MTHSSRHEDDGFHDRGRRSDDGQYLPRVAALSKIDDDFDVAEGTPDPRGWTVRDASGTDIGKVHDLIVDTVAMRTRYLDIELDKKALHLDKDRDVLVPVGQARLDDDDDRVILTSMAASRIALLPEYTHGDIDRDYENSLLPNFDEGAIDATNGGDSGAAIGAMSGDRPASRSGVIADAPESDFYDNRHFDENRFFGNRRAQQQQLQQPERTQDRLPDSERERASETHREPPPDMSIRRRAEAQQSADAATGRRDDLNVERRPVANADTASRSEMGEEEIRIPVYEDQIVVEKRRVLKEELVVKKDSLQDAQSSETNPRRDNIEGGGSKSRNQSPPEERR
jgi:photosynthetic reaction center H subunit